MDPRPSGSWPRIIKNILAALLATTVLAPCAQAQTDAERIRELELRVSDQDAVIR